MSSYAVLLEMKKKDTSHLIHFILTLFTGGLWLVIWLLCGLTNVLHNAKIDRKIASLLDSEIRQAAAKAGQ